MFINPGLTLHVYATYLWWTWVVYCCFTNIIPIYRETCLACACGFVSLVPGYSSPFPLELLSPKSRSQRVVCQCPCRLCALCCCMPPCLSLIPPGPQVPPMSPKSRPKWLFFPQLGYVQINLGASESFLWAQVRLVPFGSTMNYKKWLFSSLISHRTLKISKTSSCVELSCS